MNAAGPAGPTGAGADQAADQAAALTPALAAALTPALAADARHLVEVAVPLAFFGTLTFDAGIETRHPIGPGSRVLVAVRGRKVIGVCTGVTAADAPTRAPEKAAKLKPILAVLDPEPVFLPDLLEVCGWLADYYVAPVGMVLRAALPVALGAARRPDPAVKTQRVLQVVRALPTLTERDAIFKRAPQQRAAYDLLDSLGGRADAAKVISSLGCSPGIITALAKRELIRIEVETVARDPFAARDARAARVAGGAAKPPTPTDAQRAAIDSLTAAAPGSVALLHGITGSGKTLVYLELLRKVVTEQGRTAIVLVPEIALTPQTVDRFRAVFGDQVAVLHSALSDGERYDAWKALRSGEKRIAVGARSAVFAPLPNLGAVIVDEEHESSYKQGESPRYHARDVAIVRARAAGAVCVLGSATPSLESWQNVIDRKYTKLSLPDRVGGGALPKVEIIDLRETTKSVAAADRNLRHILSDPLERAIHARLARNEQTILLLNRRGYSSFVQCSACEWVAACPRCSISLTYHRVPERLVCHYCLHGEALHANCPQCGAATLRQRGLGTQQVERVLGERFPSARIARMDVDTTSGKWAHAEILDRVGSGEVDILLGTQMIAKGLDFPNVTLVGVIDADVGINLPDFRASERTYQLVSQVAGRAGRGPKGGEVIVQTRAPTHHALTAALTHDYAAFVAEELASRVSPAYPPTVRLANIVISATREDAAAEAATQAGEWFVRALAQFPPGVVEVIGPAPCAVDRIKDRWRWHLVLRAWKPSALTRISRRFLTTFDLPARAGLRVTFDRDPVSLL
ncbi:MAG: primosomal protein N' [Gemmatimonadetes bacterium]|nr:primosomal protein N' [Gemmatimonadota bacterium]